MLNRRYITLAEVEAIHDELIKRIGGDHGYRDKGLVDSAVNRIHTGYYRNIFEEAAALIDSISNNQGFLDGNKRTAFTSADTFLRWNGFYMNVEQDAAERLMINATKTMDPKTARHVFRFPLILEWIFTDYEVLEGFL
jgi:death on curing protein